MKKWSLILWFAVIVGAAFIFTACEGDDSDDGAGETFTDVSIYYSLKSGEGETDPDESGLEIASALKSSSTGDVTIVLAGTVKPDYIVAAVARSGTLSTVILSDTLSKATDWTDKVWRTADDVAGAEPGDYGAVYISNLITDPIAAGTVAIKQTNEALRLYKSRPEILDDAPDAPLVPDAPNIWIPEAGEDGTPVKWKVYVDNATNKAPKLETGAFGVLIWNGGDLSAPYSNKQAVLEIETASIGADGTVTLGDGLFQRYIIDYSGVKFDTTGQYPLVEKDGSITTSRLIFLKRRV
jgi:hypothetical protein